MFFNFKSSKFSAVRLVIKAHYISVIYMVQQLQEKNSSNCHSISVYLYHSSYRILLGLGSSKPWEDILEDFAGVRTFSAKPCLKYFQPLRDYLEELVAKGELKVGWTCETNHSSRRTILKTNLLFLFTLNLFFSTRFFSDVK